MDAICHKKLFYTQKFVSITAELLVVLDCARTVVSDLSQLFWFLPCLS